MIYADFPYYQDFYCGTSITDAAAFRTAAARASEYLDSITFGRLQSGIPEAYTEQVKNCCCSLSEALALFLDAKSGMFAGSNGSKTAETIGKYSVSYSKPADVAAALLDGNTAGLQSYLYRICEQYLGRTGLLYRGCNEDCM